MTPITGSIVALATPMQNDGSVDYPTLRKLIDWHIAEGTDCICVVGTTGESPTVNVEEHCEIIRVSVEHARGRVPIMAGAGGNATAEAIELTRYAKKVGADCSLQVVPYYNKPTQEGLYQHYKAIHDAAELPIIIYNIPGRCVIDMSVATMARLAKLPNIVGVKDATADLARPLRTRVEIGPEFCQLSGEDATVTAFLAQGGVGCISVTANVAPAQCAALHDAWKAQDLETVWRLRDRLMPLHDALFVETSPGPVKYAASLLGLCSAETRLPLAPVTDHTRSTVREALIKAGVLV